MIIPSPNTARIPCGGDLSHSSDRWRHCIIICRLYFSSVCCRAMCVRMSGWPFCFSRSFFSCAFVGVRDEGSVGMACGGGGQLGVGGVAEVLGVTEWLQPTSWHHKM